MTPKVVLTTDLTEQQAEDMLRNGALIVFGDQFLEVAGGLTKEGMPGVPILAGERVADLKLPDTLMLYAMMVFAHTLPGLKGKPATKGDLAAWKEKLFDRVDFVTGQEPMPTAEFSLTEGTRDVITQLTWTPPATGDWQGVRSGQVRRIAGQFETRHDLATASSGDPAGTNAGWRRFEHPDRMFTISYPTRLTERRVPGSGAAFSCVSSDGAEMMEVLVMQAGKPLAKDELVQIAADGMVKDIDSRAGGRLVHRRRVAEGPKGACVSLKGEHTEAGQKFTTDYLFVGAGRDALYVALKCPSSRFDANKADFDRACASLTTPWLAGTGHGTKGVSEARVTRDTPASMRVEPEARRSSGARWVGLVVLIGLIALTGYLYATDALPPEITSFFQR